jgi:hypothetical protein
VEPLEAPPHELLEAHSASFAEAASGVSSQTIPILRSYMQLASNGRSFLDFFFNCFFLTVIFKKKSF